MMPWPATCQRGSIPILPFRIREDLDALGIEAVEARVRQDVPVGGLKIMQAFDLALAREMARRIGK